MTFFQMSEKQENQKPVQPEYCSFCRNLFTEGCPICGYDGKTDTCPVVKGRCGHQFHLHCIEIWLAKNTTCPECQDSWSPVDNA